MATKVDLHVHSKYSDRPSEWILRRIGAPESFVEPHAIYRIAKQRGMQFVTISDHNCIDGALEIAHLPGTFLSSEITTYFPEDGCKIHCLVSGVSEEQFREIQQLRENIYDFQSYLREQDIVYSVAHPLFRVMGGGSGATAKERQEGLDHRYLRRRRWREPDDQGDCRRSAAPRWCWKRRHRVFR